MKKLKLLVKNIVRTILGDNGSIETTLTKVDSFWRKGNFSEIIRIIEKYPNKQDFRLLSILARSYYKLIPMSLTNFEYLNASTRNTYSLNSKKSFDYSNEVLNLLVDDIYEKDDLNTNLIKFQLDYLVQAFITNQLICFAQDSHGEEISNRCVKDKKVSSKLEVFYGKGIDGFDELFDEYLSFPEI